MQPFQEENFIKKKKFIVVVDDFVYIYTALPGQEEIFGFAGHRRITAIT